MDNRIDQIHKEVVDVRVILERNTVTLEQNTRDMSEHIKRTGILEKQMRTALIPIQIAKWASAVLGVLASIAGIVYTIWDIVNPK